MATFWETAPSDELVPNLRRYRDRVLDAIEQLASYFAAKMEGYAKGNARWTDRTGAARSGLRAFTIRAATYVVIVLANSVQYGAALEIAHGGKYAIVMRTLQAHYQPLMAAMRRLVAG